MITFSSLSKAYLAPGWRAGWMAVGRTDRLDDVLAAVKKLADGRLCATGPMEYAITAALNGDRSHQVAFREALRERANVTIARLNAIDGITVVAPTAAFYAMPQVALPPGVTDEQTTCSACSARPACSASTAPGSARGPRMASSGSSSSPAGGAARRSTTTSAVHRGVPRGALSWRSRRRPTLNWTAGPASVSLSLTEKKSLTSGRSG